MQVQLTVASIVLPYAMKTPNMGGRLLSSPLDEAASSAPSSTMRSRIMANITQSRAARQASNFTQHANFERAYNFYRSGGWTADRTLSHMQGIDFTGSVSVVSLPQGTAAVQYMYPNTAPGNYYAPIGTPANTLGINPTGRVPTFFSAAHEVQVLRSTAATIPDWAGSSMIFEGGGTQWFTHTPSHFTPVP